MRSGWSIRRRRFLRSEALAILVDELVDHAEEVLERSVELFSAVAHPLDRLLGGRIRRGGIACEPVERVASDRHPIERDQPEQLPRALAAHRVIGLEQLDRRCGRAHSERAVAVAAQAEARSARSESPVSWH